MLSAFFASADRWVRTEKRKNFSRIWDATSISPFSATARLPDDDTETQRARESAHKKTSNDWNFFLVIPFLCPSVRGRVEWEGIPPDLFQSLFSYRLFFILHSAFGAGSEYWNRIEKTVNCEVVEKVHVVLVISTTLNQNEGLGCTFPIMLSSS